mgnify:CR=1 FL=1
MRLEIMRNFAIIKYIPLQQGLRRKYYLRTLSPLIIIKYIPLQQGLRLNSIKSFSIPKIIKYIPLQQGLRLNSIKSFSIPKIIKYIPLQQGLIFSVLNDLNFLLNMAYNKCLRHNIFCYF